MSGLVWEKFFLGAYVSAPFEIRKNTDPNRKIRHSWLIYHYGKVVAARKTLRDAKEYCQESHNNTEGDLV